MQRNRQRKRNRNASDFEVDRELAAQPEPSQAQKSKKASGEARRDRHHKNTWHAKKAKRHTVMRGVCAAGLEAGAVVASEVVEARLVTQIEAWVEACSMRALLGSLLLGLAVRGWWLHPVRSMATRSRIRGLMCSTSKGIRFYDRDVSAALNIARIAAGPGRPRELSSWLGRPAMPNPGRPGQEWVQVRDRGLLRKWQRRHQRQR
ncbi:hypothetical protein QJQ45_029982 [Haematococcus lacustris]|nr:hypothetical protein QJQ45_029982 [Haematococcus lacustris]